MNLRMTADTLGLTALVAPRDTEREVTGGYASDLLSCVIAGAKAGNIWLTVQTHPNIIAVASLLDLAGIIVTESPNAGHVDQSTIEKAMEEDVALYTSPLDTYALIARLTRVMDTPEVDM
jgi:hypothetical protein